ncbi:preprotein translocase subunit SecA [Buchnera aphidicola (Takecallis taiwana)]
MKCGTSLDSLLPEAFATVREASKRVFHMRHFDVQLAGGIILYENCIAEMCTGEGKTLTATLSAYLNALSGHGVHIVTMNEYLAQRDANKNKTLFEFLGLKVGLLLSNMSIKNKQEAYLADITYGTNHEFCFDYLRDNMVFSCDQKVQRGLFYALIDEVDSILIDEARTPLIISGPSKENIEMYHIINKLVPHFILQKIESVDPAKYTGHFFIDEKSKQVFLTELGLQKVESLLSNCNFIKNNQSLYSSQNFVFIQHIISALRAHFIFFRDIDYIIKDKKVIIIDEHTGRMMPDRRWSDGLHQAIEAKENINILHTNHTLASITLQNYFKMYKKLSGMTGTASTEAFELEMIYGLKTVTIPTNYPMIRKDLTDLIYITERDKIHAIIKDIQYYVVKNQPVLVGTTSIQKSEIISKQLTKLGIKHNVLNAKSYKKEADIISKAGKLSAVTISTNMAGRGTDIILGGIIKINPKIPVDIHDQYKQEEWLKEHNHVISLGGLHVIGTERHESRRIDNQLIGRTGRQGAPGSSRFYLSLEDPLIRIFISNSMKNFILKFNTHSDKPIEHNWIMNAITYAQKRVENYNFEIRKELLEYDDILNTHRNIFYFIRDDILNTKNSKYIVLRNFLHVIYRILKLHCSNNVPNIKWNIQILMSIFKNDFNLFIPIERWLKDNTSISTTCILHKIYRKVQHHYRKVEKITGYNNIRIMEKNIMLNTVDFFWKEHLSFMEYLRHGIHLRGYAQKNPKHEYIKESFFVFSKMLDTLKYEISANIIKKIFYI